VLPGDMSFLRSRRLCSYSRTSHRFMKPESSLPCSQDHSIGSYLEPHKTSPYHPFLSVYYPPPYVLLFLALSIFLAVAPISYMYFSSPQSCYMPCPSHPPCLDHCNYLNIYKRFSFCVVCIYHFSFHFPFECTRAAARLMSGETGCTETSRREMTYHILRPVRT
jgi:hypothetical protein